MRAGAVALFDTELRRSLAQWRAEGKKGIWLKIPLEASATVGRAVQQGFSFHHTKEERLKKLLCQLNVFNFNFNVLSLRI